MKLFTDITNFTKIIENNTLSYKNCIYFYIGEGKIGNLC